MAVAFLKIYKFPNTDMFSLYCKFLCVGKRTIILKLCAERFAFSPWYHCLYSANDAGAMMCLVK